MAVEPTPREVAGALYASVGLFIRRLRHIQPVPGDVSLPEVSALARLGRAGTATPGELAKLEQISPQAIGVTLAALERRSLVERRPDPHDGRRTVMSLTRAGKQAVRNKHNARTQQFAKALSTGFTPGELRTLLEAAALLERLAENIR